MATISFSHYHKEDLLSLAEKVNTEYYDVIENLCNNHDGLAIQVQSSEGHASTVLYINLCSKLIEELKHHIRLRKQVVIPYIRQLHEKSSDGHDCGTCSGKCSMQHHTQLHGIKEAHLRIKDILYHLRKVALPVYSDTEEMSEYNQLRNEILMIETIVTELFYIEEALLIPKIMEAQKNIRVGG